MTSSLYVPIELQYDVRFPVKKHQETLNVHTKHFILSTLAIKLDK